MTYHTSHLPSSLSLDLSARISGLAGFVMTTLRDFRAARATRNALMALSDAQLEDIGLSRAELSIRKFMR